MPIPELQLVRPWRRITATLLFILSAVALLRCGSSKDKNDNPSPDNPVVTEVPTDWQATEDWQNSSWKVEDEE